MSHPDLPVRILLTGFGPFPEVPYNASAHLARSIGDGADLPARPCTPRIKIFTEVIPVVWDGAVDLAQAAIARYRPHAVLHFGVSRRASVFEIETRAFNMSGSKQDQAGSVRPAKPLLPARPMTLPATLPGGALLRALKAAGFPALLSNDAGRYLCNAVFYASLNRANGGLPLVTFIHVPALGADTAVAPRLSMENLVDGARILVRASADAVIRARLETAHRSDREHTANGSQGLYRTGRSSSRFVWRN
jgi:pyroglutamyl-peptidase